MVRKILKAGDPRLRETSKPVKKIDKKIFSLIAELKETLVAQKEPEGVGLAAPQLGKKLRIFVISHKDKIRTFINPEIIAASKDRNQSEKRSRTEEKSIMEGCLSLPNYYGSIKRSPTIKVKYLNTKGKKVSQTFQGLPAQIVQHEIDHLNGILFIDRLLEQKKSLYELEGDAWKEVDLVI